MGSQFSPSTNIIRDRSTDLNYHVTPNAKKIAFRLINDFQQGFHSFSIIGSYGTGKSSFLWALENTLVGKKNFFEAKTPKGVDNVEFINIVGSYQSLIKAFSEEFNVKKDYSGHQLIFDTIYQRYESIGGNGLLVIIIDEFGKFLEFIAKNNPEKEMYFIQQLAEFVNAPDRNIMMISTLHQSFESYANGLSEGQRNEWLKVKGRVKEITFNEPIEQLLFLAAEHLSNYVTNQGDQKYSNSIVELIGDHHLFNVNTTFLTEIRDRLFPLELISAYVVTNALQKYGQNERSLFAFLQDSEHVNEKLGQTYFDLPVVYDYLYRNLYSFINSKHNPDYANWSAIRTAHERVDSVIDNHHPIAVDIIKIIGLISVFSSKGARINQKFIEDYLSNKYSRKEVSEAINDLSKKKIIRFNSFNDSFKLFEGTDLDIESELIRAENRMEHAIDIVPKLNSHFEFPVIHAKKVSYLKGTPRLFEFVLSESPISTTPSGEIDGYINLVFNDSITIQNIKSHSSNANEAILYGVYRNTEEILKTLFEIEKIDQVLNDLNDSNDKVAIKELTNIQNSHKTLLNHYVLNSLYSDKIDWVFGGETRPITSKKEFNQLLSFISEEVYSSTPILRNELYNKHKVSGAISTARKNYFQAMVENWEVQDLGFAEDKFPAEKTIYISLLRETGIHVGADGFFLQKPSDKSIKPLWDECEAFLKEAKEERLKLSVLIDRLSQRPFKLKQGLVDFWVPTFLFIKRGDFALYGDNGFIPYVNEITLYSITRNPKEYSIKSFELSDLRLNLFNKYRKYLNQEEKKAMNTESFIESIRPFLVLYKGLTDYSKKTKRLSPEALALRTAIEHSEDPEKVFFEDFPKALNFDVSELVSSQEIFDDYIYKFQTVISEIKNSYAELLNRFELLVIEKLGTKSKSFSNYKKLLQERYSNLKEHNLLPEQRAFVQRVKSALSDRDSWLDSIAHPLIKRPLSRIADKDEKLLESKLGHMIRELDNLCEIETLEFDESKEEVFKLDITSKDQGLSEHVIRISKDKVNEANDKLKKINNLLGDDKQLKIAMLARLLNNELKNE